MAWTLVDSWTHSGDVNEVEFTDLGSYREILVKFRDVNLPFGASLRGQLSKNNGSSYIASGYSVSSGATTDTSFWVGHITHPFTGVENGWCRIHDFNQSDRYKLFTHLTTTAGGFMLLDEDAMDALRVFTTSGNITAGTIEIWGRDTVEPEWEEIDSWTYSTDVAQVDFTGLAGYEAIMILLEGVTTSVATPTYFRVSTNNGSSYEAGSIYEDTGSAGVQTSTGGNIQSGSTTSARYARATIYLWDKASEKVCLTRQIAAAGDGCHGIDLTSACNAIRIIPGSGNITGGKIRIMGLGTGDGGWTLLSSWSHATDVAEVEIDNLPSGYSRFQIKVLGVDTELSRELRCQVSDDNGSSYYSGSQYIFGSTGASTSSQLDIGSATSLARNLWVEIDLPDAPPPFYNKSGSTTSGIAISGSINALRFFQNDSGNITAGTIEIWGLSETTANMLVAERFDNAATFHQPSVSPGEVIAAPLLFANGQAFFQPTMGVGILPSLFANQQVYYDQVIAGQNLQPSLYQNQQTFLEQTLIHIPNQYITPGLFTNPQVFQTHVLGGSIGVQAPKHDNAQAFMEADVANVIFVTMPLLTLESIIYAPEIFQPARRDPTWNNYYCARSGFKVPYDRLVPDGEIEGMYVEKGWEDEPHPQKYPRPVGGDEITQANPPPSQDPNDEYVPVKLIIDGDEYNV